MKRKRKLIATVVLSVLICFVASGSTAYAAIEPLYFYLTNTGKSFNPNHEMSSNIKSYQNEPWSINIQHIYFSKGVPGAGMAYVLYRSSRPESGTCWVNSIQAKQGSWGSYQGVAGATYVLYGRMDDDLGGYCESSGQWNSDTIGQWFW